MQRPPQYPPQSPQSISNQRSLSPPLPGSPQAYAVNFQNGGNKAFIDHRINNSQNFQQFPQNSPQPYFHAQPLTPGNIQNIHYAQSQSVSHLNAPAYNSKPNSPVHEVANNQNRIYHSQSVHVGSPRNINTNYSLPQGPHSHFVQQGNVHFNYNGSVPLPNSLVQPLPEQTPQVMPNPPR